MTNEKLQKKWYAWVGQNASTGSPNKITGHLSYYGRNYVFGTRAERDEFVDEFRSNNPSEFCIACTKRELRGRNLGISVSDFEDDLRGSMVTKCNDGKWDYC